MIRKLALQHTTDQLFRGLFADEPYCFWLDNTSRWSYMGAASGEVLRGSDIFDALSARLSDRRQSEAIPFSGGYVGYFGYPTKSPEAIFVRAERFLAIDHLTNSLYAVSNSEAWIDEIEQRIVDRPATGDSGGIEIGSALSHDEYLVRVKECLALIAAGESYELCLTNQVRVTSTMPPLRYYENLRRLNPAPYSAYLNFGDLQVACSSPECFLRIDPQGNVESRPIKGTLPRGQSAAEDERLRTLLATDEKFRAENLMIVDLIRNDLGRVCELGSVSVPRLMEVETYATVHQLVSTITGRLRRDATVIDCIRAAFPGGSMTGAPKIRAMELLDRMEPCARGIYSGSLGWLGFDGAADLNIVIRTAVFRNGEVTIGTGGAIVAGSDPEAEWNEMRLKADVLLRCFSVRKVFPYT